MVEAGRRTRWFAAGAAAAAAIVFCAWFALSGPSRTPATAERVVQQPAAPAADVRAVAAAPAASAPTVVAEAVPISVSTCPPQPAVPVAGGQRDGGFSLESALGTEPLPSAAAFMAVAREAMGQGRPRDAEVAFIAACHVAERMGGSHSVGVADAKTQLGEHYVALAAHAPGAEADLLPRATALLSESADAYAAALGKGASRTRIAEQRLAAVRAGSVQEAATRLAGLSSGADASVLGASRASMVDSLGNARQLVASDPELSQLESDIGRLQAQASRVTRDPAGMRKRDAEAVARAAQCEDKACLLRWYALRRSQLLNEF